MTDLLDTERPVPRPDATGGNGSAPRRATSGSAVPWWLRRSAVTSLTGIAALYTLLPLIWLLFAVTKTLPELYSGNGFSPSAGFHVLDNVRDLFAQDDGRFGRWMLNTAIYAIGGALIATLLSVAAGYAFDKFAFRGKEKWYGLVIAGVLIPHTAIVIPLYLMMSNLQLTDTMWSVLIPVMVNPFGVYLARAYSSGAIPDELLEAARIDGAGEVRTFFSVGLRMMLPGALTIFLIQFIGIWNNFFLPMVMITDNDLFSLGQGLFTWNSATSQNPDYTRLVVVGSAVTTLPLILLFIPLQRWWRAGLAEGGIK
ncbi:carbohydrate ABC transporter permease [Streptomyces radicis]|uniref:Carbohydrate ABC transporter permease n=1 Tax=Streptomyces radicis TaxID=1750517 RepID=A0A3A9WE98_9ACTN|nr:carbohydrate ABC transporter permease [Streptomyces radicis]RKN05976.1 carbohydrate ABC transporter permease [Streptomyces radicis]RKN17716.1 carbohydrate ABC transporter permease [Streptomyces radicis]